MRRMRLLCTFSVSLSGRKVIVACMFIHGSSEQAIGVSPQCLVQKRIVCFVLAHIHGLACCFFICLLEHYDPAVSNPEWLLLKYDRQTILMNNDANPFASFLTRDFVGIEHPYSNSQTLMHAPHVFRPAANFISVKSFFF